MKEEIERFHVRAFTVAAKRWGLTFTEMKDFTVPRAAFPSCGICSEAAALLAERRRDLPHSVIWQNKRCYVVGDLIGWAGGFCYPEGFYWPEKKILYKHFRGYLGIAIAESAARAVHGYPKELLEMAFRNGRRCRSLLGWSVARWKEEFSR